MWIVCVLRLKRAFVVHLDELSDAGGMGANRRDKQRLFCTLLNQVHAIAILPCPVTSAHHMLHANALTCVRGNKIIECSFTVESFTDPLSLVNHFYRNRFYGVDDGTVVL